ncbi:hypothetical protein F511_23232 [Dorcoceras hygrometricum]|uniref:Aminotransferase-like plant mobile domain-containing protein n=1 Tax=Dorcoceras hygrometricum TaxID=472368 RepID=A0A2Z7CH55_9LAMI|nr:hypothetical protein F511_23232 [Dorcoceras hygrometricum]
MPVLAISSGRLDYFLNRFDVPSCSFLINDDVMIPFRASDFSIVLGLHHSGQPVDLDLKMESRFLARHFASKVTKADRAAIRERMMLLAGTSYVTPGFIFPYLDDLTTFFDHAWGDAAFRFLYREICHLGSKMYLDGCVVGLMALVYESIPTLGVRRSLNLYPRLFRWGKSKIPLKSDEADTLLNRVDITQVLPIRPFNEEENLVDLRHVERSEDGMPEVRRLEKIVIRQSEKIKLLEKRCAELEDQNLRHELNVAEAVVEKGEKSGEGAELDEASKDGNEANKDVEGSELSLSKLNEITVFQSSIVDNVRTRADRVKKRKGSMFVTPPSSTPRQKKRVKKQALVYESIPTLGVRRSLNLYPRLFRWGKSKIPLKSAEADTLLNLVDITQVLPIRPFNKEENLVSEYGIPEVRRLEKIVIRQSEKIKLLEKRCAELEDQNLRHELNVAEAVVEKGEKSGEGAELDEASKDGNEANKDVEGSELSLSKLNEITVFQSSIVDNVRTRADRVKKRKGSMFVTPPSSTPRQKTRVKKQTFVDVDEAINRIVEEELDELRTIRFYWA